MFVLRQLQELSNWSEFPRPPLAHRITRPVGWAEGGFYAVPMAKGLRLAGTVEIAALDAPKNKGRIDHITRKGSEMFANLPTPTSDWLGYRPSMPDALPVIGPSTVSDRIIHAFGHQHLGERLKNLAC
ncbi:MAG: FAD-dependent oxidoreductase [Roseovarius sp.]